ncbi:hypothetical protein yrohd0001_28660 [Yersinia rohdei ATCC 43380]|nr:hypothetical protein yrohd0001_28660 [Yersinia rohdei ATCC 43380]
MFRILVRLSLHNRLLIFFNFLLVQLAIALVENNFTVI